MGYWKKQLFAWQSRHRGNITALERSLQATSKHFRSVLAQVWLDQEREMICAIWEREMECVMVDFSKLLKGRGGKGVVSPYEDEAFAKSWPTLFAMCSCEKDEAGLPRRTSTINLFFEEGAVKGMLKERNADLLLFVTVPTLLDVFDALERALNAPVVDWKTARADGTTSRRRS